MLILKVINVGHTKDEDGPITMTMKKAAMYPIAVSVTLLIIYFYNVNVTQLSVPTSSLFNDNKVNHYNNILISWFTNFITYFFRLLHSKISWPFAFLTPSTLTSSTTPWNLS